jgi:Na+-transporting methylmalonyl-CoA/oxaloacetate decarboxylase gamma subunit
MLQRCLSYEPTARPSATQLQTELFGREPEPPPQSAPMPESEARSGRLPGITVLVLLILAVAVWAALRLFHSHPNLQPAAAATAAAPAAALPPPAPTAALSDAIPAAVHVHSPEVALSALKTIHGHIRIAVLVSVDRFGAVNDVRMKSPGSSEYFARLARQAATQSTFPPAAGPGTRRWLLRYEFSRGGATAVATPQS